MKLITDQVKECRESMIDLGCKTRSDEGTESGWVVKRMNGKIPVEKNEMCGGDRKPKRYLERGVV
jgi:hypothetical protein